jgi:hypothetical protein
MLSSDAGNRWREPAGIGLDHNRSPLLVIRWVHAALLITWITLSPHAWAKPFTKARDESDRFVPYVLKAEVLSTIDQDYQYREENEY